MGSDANILMPPQPVETASGGYGREFVGGLCPALLTLEKVIGEIAPTAIPILLVGESGTGKEVFAYRIHALSSRFAEPIVKISCASVNAEMLCLAVGPAR